MKFFTKEALEHLIELEKAIRKEDVSDTLYLENVQKIASIYEEMVPKGVSNQRKFNRIETPLYVRFFYGQAEKESSIGDFSLGGFCLLQSDPILPDFNRFFAEEISDGKEKFPLGVWCQVVRPSFLNRRPNDCGRIGIQFVQDTDKAKERIYRAFDFFYLRHLQDLLAQVPE